MNRRVSLLIISVIIGAAALAGALLCEKKSYEKLQRKTLMYTDEMILALPYFDLVVVGDENHIPSDIESYSLGDGEIHLMLPEDINMSNVVVYVRDADGNYLARRQLDLSQKVMIGPWEVVAEHHTLPVLYFNSEDPEVYMSMNAATTKDIICDGNVHICVGKDMAHEKGWYRE